MNAGTVGAWKQYLDALVKRGAVKADEVEWTGVREWLDIQQGKVRKQQVAEFLNANGVRVEEVVLQRDVAPVWAVTDSFGNRETFASEQEAEEAAEVWRDEAWDQMRVRDEDIDVSEAKDGSGEWVVSVYNASYGEDEHRFENEEDAREFADNYAKWARREMDESIVVKRVDDARDDADQPKYDKFTLPGGTNYREVLLTLPAKPKPKPAGLRLEPRGDYPGSPGGFNAFIGDKFVGWGQTEAEAQRVAADNATPDAPQYKSDHWDVPNVLAHVRLTDRVDAEGRRVLMVEEVQGDWPQAMRKQREAIAKAVDNDFDGIVKRMQAAGVLTVECD